MLGTRWGAPAVTLYLGGCGAQRTDAFSPHDQQWWMASCVTWKVSVGDGPGFAARFFEHLEGKVEKLATRRAIWRGSAPYDALVRRVKLKDRSVVSAGCSRRAYLGAGSIGQAAGRKVCPLDLSRLDR